MIFKQSSEQFSHGRHTKQQNTEYEMEKRRMNHILRRTLALLLTVCIAAALSPLLPVSALMPDIPAGADDSIIAGSINSDVRNTLDLTAPGNTTVGGGNRDMKAARDEPAGPTGPKSAEPSEPAEPESAGPATPEVTPVKVLETGELFGTLAEAIAATDKAGLDTLTLEISGDVKETSSISIKSNITIVAAKGAFTVDTYDVITVESGGSLTLGGGAAENTLTILGSVSVNDGTITVNDGVILKSKNRQALLLSGPDAKGSISGGRLEGGDTALWIEKGAQVSEISGGVFTGRQDAVLLTDTGTKLGKISGGAFYQTVADTNLHGHAVFVQNYSQIGEISGGFFEATRNCALVVIRGGRVGEISGGEFTAKRIGSLGSPDTRNSVVWIENGWTSEGFEVTGIDTISGGRFKGAYFGVLAVADYSYSYINRITGGVFEGIVALQSDRGSVIGEISGGKFTGSQGIFNVGIITKISGVADIYGRSSYAVINYPDGRIDEISGGTIVSGASSGIMNYGTIKLVSGSTIVGALSAITCDGSVKGRLETITGGVFWGKARAAIVPGYELKLEPGLNDTIGFGRYMGIDGTVFSSEDLVIYPDGYWMSAGTLPVSGIPDVGFKYLTNGRAPIAYTVTFDTNGGRFIGDSLTDDSLADDKTTATRTVTPPASAVGNENMPPRPVYRAYRFNSWNTVRDGSGTAFTGMTEVTGDITVYAQWTRVPDELRPILVRLKATKVVSGEGATLENGQFSFAVYNGGAVVATGVNDTNGIIVFSAINYTHAGTYTYTIKETSSSGNGWTADSREYGVTVVIVNNDRVLSAEVIYEGGAVPTFNNRYGNSGQGGGNTDVPNPPEVELPWDEIPLYPFVSEHVAYIIGYPDGRVGPNLNITRAETVTIFFRLLADQTRAYYWTQENPFSDVSRDMWYNNAISVMTRMGIIDGYPDGTFKPDNAITRAEFTTIVARFARMMQIAPEYDVSFGDTAEHWAEREISYAASVGWINGYSDGTFKPVQRITRAEAIMLVNRMLGRIPESDGDLLQDSMILWPDNMDPGMWYYLAVQEASNSHLPEFKSKPVPGLHTEYEFWTAMLPKRDWSQLEKDWADAYSG